MSREPGIQRRTLADVEADRLAQLEHLDQIGEVLDEMQADAEIDVHHRSRSTQDERLAYVSELVARGSDHSLAMAKRELRLITTTPTPSLKRRILERPKRPIQILPTHYRQPR